MAQSAYSGRGNKQNRVLRASGKAPEIHCMVIPAGAVSLMLPTSVMAEVVDYHQPLEIEETPSWLLGQIEWNNRQVPVFDFHALIDGSDPGPVPKHAKIMVLKTLTDSARMPYIGLLMEDLPRTAVVRETDLRETGDEKKSLGVFSHVSFNEEQAIVPDMDRLSHLVRHATFGALPITQLDD